MERRIHSVLMISFSHLIFNFSPVRNTNDYINLKLYDYDAVGTNDLLGEIELPVATFYERPPKSEWYPLKEKKGVGIWKDGKGNSTNQLSNPHHFQRRSTP